MAKFDYTDEMEARMRSAAADGVTEQLIGELVDEFEFPRRSVTAKLRKMGFDVPKKPGAAPVFSQSETAELSAYLEANSSMYTAEELAAHFSKAWGREVTARQINGKALSLEATAHVKAAEKKVTPKTYTEAEENKVKSLAQSGKYLEDIAEAVGKSVNSVRGKLLSLGLKAPQRDKKAAKADAYEGIEEMTDKTVADIAAHFSKTERGVKTVLARRKLKCADYTPKVSE